MGIIAFYDAVPLPIVEAYLDDFDGLRELCESPNSPCWHHYIDRAWRFAWCVLEPEAFLAVDDPEDIPAAPRGPLGAAVVGAEPLNVRHSKLRREEFRGVLYHTRWLDLEAVARSAAALGSVTQEDVERAYEIGAVARSFPRGAVKAAEAMPLVEGLASFYGRASGDGRAVVTMVG